GRRVVRVRPREAEDGGGDAETRAEVALAEVEPRGEREAVPRRRGEDVEVFHRAEALHVFPVAIAREASVPREAHPLEDHLPVPHLGGEGRLREQLDADALARERDLEDAEDGRSV